MRAFLGIPIPDELKSKIISVQKRFSGFGTKLVESENLHFNLKFFAEIDDENVGKLKEVLEDVCKKFMPFEIKIQGLGAFPNSEYVRVVWIGVNDGYDEMVSLAGSIDKSIQSLGFKPEDRFVPHITLVRVKSGRNKSEIAKLLEEYDDKEMGSMKIDKMILFQSKLGPSGPKYEEVFEVKLAS